MIMNFNDRKTAWAKLMHEHKELQRAYADGHGTYNSASAAAVVRVNKGEQVYARLMAGTVHSGSNYHYTSFVGFLVLKL